EIVRALGHAHERIADVVALAARAIRLDQTPVRVGRAGHDLAAFARRRGLADVDERAAVDARRHPARRVARVAVGGAVGAGLDRAAEGVERADLGRVRVAGAPGRIALRDAHAGIDRGGAADRGLRVGIAEAEGRLGAV